MKTFLRLALAFFLIGCCIGYGVASAQVVIVANRSNVDHEAIYSHGLGTWTFPVKAHTVVQVPVNGTKTSSGAGIGTTAYGTSGGLPSIGPGEYWYLEITNDSGQYNGPISGYTYESSATTDWSHHILAVSIVLLLLLTIYLALYVARN